MTPIEIATQKARFLAILTEKAGNRPGVNNLIAFLEQSDFFTAPASTKYHENYEGGLCEHSLVVYDKLVLLNTILPEKARMSDETVAICALLHDICKTGFYTAGTRNVKNEVTGQWEKVPVYNIADSFPVGHGEKSVIMLMRYIPLTDEELYAIRWHMGAFDESVKGGSYAIGNAYEACPSAVNLSIADMQATYQKI